MRWNILLHGIVPSELGLHLIVYNIIAMASFVAAGHRVHGPGQIELLSALEIIV